MKPLRGISSMAPRQMLAELAATYAGHPVSFEAAGGLDVASRLRAGEAFDVVVLAADVIKGLIADGCLLEGSRVDLARSGIAVAVPCGAMPPDIATEAAVRDAVLTAEAVAVSSGPSGRALTDLFERWGIARQIAERVICPPPGVPVGAWVAEGRASLGFQQRSELIHVAGIDVVGSLPPEIQVDTVFSAGIGAGSVQVPEVRRLLAFMTSPQADDAKRREGMSPA
ncbi:substrate-binding domain-containing protein [Nitrogeniibacter aestuarii]|uniref:substrate-binding domain-containing protein n=1 Tax=Nitrogeniibacter aestuarii TaxID=2815343 RepID=UPI001E3E7F24|nr:substrate-binding domain-containing protein [Nitrogeniibacter aestuarii]